MHIVIVNKVGQVVCYLVYDNEDKVVDVRIIVINDTMGI